MLGNGIGYTQMKNYLFIKNAKYETGLFSDGLTREKDNG